MLGRDELCGILEEKLKIIAINSSQAREYTLKLNSEFDIPIDKANDIICMRVSVANESDFIIYAVTYTICRAYIIGHFSDQEINTYSIAKFEAKQDIFPLKYRMVQVKENQWIGKITAKQLMQLRDAQIVYYNEKAQRTMQQIIKGAVVHFRIMVNQFAVKGIMASMMNGTYIPNTLTFNLPEDIEYTYDEKTCMFTIEEQPSLKLDILDGYHRYLAISRAYNLNHDFDYEMELRFVQFPETKAKQFVWQEDQKTPMKKLDSIAMNQTTIPAKVIERLNVEPNFILEGEINPNGGIINSSYLNMSIKSVFCKDNEKLDKKSEFLKVKEITEKLKNLINELVVLDSATYDEKPWSRKQILAVVLAAHDDKKADEVQTYLDIINGNKNLFSKIGESGYSKNEIARFYSCLKENQEAEV